MSDLERQQRVEKLIRQTYVMIQEQVSLVGVPLKQCFAMIVELPLSRKVAVLVVNQENGEAVEECRGIAREDAIWEEEFDLMLKQDATGMLRVLVAFDGGCSRARLQIHPAKGLC